MDAPIQVVRENPIDSGGGNDVAGLNAAMWKLIGGANPKSVFLNYELVNTLWPNSPATIPPGSRVPLTEGDPQPPQTTEMVANTTLETYVQNTLTCLDCHASAAIASEEAEVLSVLRPPKPGASSPSASPAAPYASDYSFLLGRAKSSATRPSPGQARSRAPLAVAGLGGAVLLGAAAVALAKRRSRN
jgi:hypothetical protein